MATPFPFTSGQTLTSAQMNAITTLPSTTKTASHTLVIADQGTRVIMNSGTATTITVNNSIFGASDVVEIQNIGTAICTVTAGSCTVSSAGPLAIPQHGGGQLVFSSASAATFFPTAVTATASGLTLIKTQTIGTTVSSVEVTGAFSATYDNYKVIVSDGAASAQVDLQLQLGATTTGYYAGYAIITYSSGVIAGKGNNNAANFTDFGGGNSNGLNGCVDILSPFLAKNTFVVGGQAANLTTNRNAIYSGFLNNTTSYTAFTIVASGGTLTGGTIKVYGYANS